MKGSGEHVHVHGASVERPIRREPCSGTGSPFPVEPQLASSRRISSYISAVMISSGLKFFDFHSIRAVPNFLAFSRFRFPSLELPVAEYPVTTIIGVVK